ncbi:MAG: hypothetical protein GX902_03800 [Lentisphaerae bacterium]|nr:hypothetical protein [Lentisphaerota bacterium]
MKIILFALCLLSLLVCFADAPAGSSPAVPRETAVRQNPRLFLPEVIYATPGVEMNVYFDNIVLLINCDNYVFDVNCPKGRNDQKRWRFTPTESDLGTYDWSVRIIDDHGVLAEGTCKLQVSPLNAQENRPLSIMVVGDSLTAATVYPTRIFSQCQELGKINLKMLGTRGPGPERSAVPGGVGHEGYGGWTWRAFAQHKDSKFLVFPNDDRTQKGTLDVQAFFKQQNDGQPPEVITVMLGINDVFGANDENLEERIVDICNNMDVLLAEFRRCAPQAIIGVSLVTPGAATQDAFGANYKCGQTRWQYKKNQHRLNEVMKERFAASNPYGVILIPTYCNLDCENNFPQASEEVNLGNNKKISRLSNGVHPASSGYNQIGDTFFSWLMAVLPSLPAK